MNKKKELTEKEEWFKKEFKNISRLISKKDKDSLSLCDFLRIRNFKIQTSTTETEEKIKEATGKAFKLAENNKIEGAIKKLRKLNGVGIPIASAILAMRFPKKFAIIDINVITALNKKKEWEKYKDNPFIYVEYISYLRKIAKGKKLRDLEFKLFLKGQKIRKKEENRKKRIKK